ncbi:hypothetical protein Pcinc_010235 [Petrolisthes cinctipes]|uniref:Sialin n=1 Tax=Petrolisthes cinctipes TaxID=88211 RepID=A0AAE1G376_PETCI|nr:hypothetical protein Pcinc_010235 [Petrolisthes cinctipes]
MTTTTKDKQLGTPQVAAVGDSKLALVVDLDHHHHNKSPQECWGGRHTLSLLGFLGFTLSFAQKASFSVAIVAMVKSNSSADTNGSNACPLPDYNSPSNSSNVVGEFDWSETTQGQILGFPFIGYILTTLVGGMAAEHFGGKLVFGLGNLLQAFTTIVSPMCARSSVPLFIAVRVLGGGFEGVTFPAMNFMLANWIPLLERSKFSSLVYAGAQFGTVISMMVSGWLCESEFLGGWPSVFYVFGVLGVVWGLAWFVLIVDSPSRHPRISLQERNHILRHCNHSKSKPSSVPWWSVLTSVPVWSLIVVHFGQNWGFLTLLTELPTYLNNILHYDMTSSGFLSALPYLAMWVFSLLYSSLISNLQSANKLSVIAVRKISMVIGLYGPMLGLVAMCFVNCDSILAMVMLCVAVGLNGAIYCGYMCSHQDLAPNFAGSLMGLTTTVATIPGVLAPLLTGVIINDNQTLDAWRTVFLITSAVYLVTNIGYLAFMTDQVQPWNYTTSRKNTSTSHDQISTSYNHSTTSHDKKSTSHDMKSTSYNHFTTSHDKKSTSHDHIPTSHDHVSTSHDKKSTSHDHVPTSHDHVSTSHDQKSTSHDHVSTSRKNTSTSTSDPTAMDKTTVFPVQKRY